MSGTDRGRPRDPDLDHAILDVAASLYAEVGYLDITMTQIAARAGVGKQSIYRRWPSKARVLAACVASGRIDLGLITPRATGDPRGDLIEWMQASFQRLDERDDAALFRALNAAAVSTEELGAAWGDALTRALRAGIERSLRSGAAENAIRGGAELEVVVDLLLARMLFAVVTGERRTAVEIEAIVDVALAGLSH